MVKAPRSTLVDTVVVKVVVFVTRMVLTVGELPLLLLLLLPPPLPPLPVELGEEPAEEQRPPACRF